MNQIKLHEEITEELSKLNEAIEFIRYCLDSETKKAIISELLSNQIGDIFSQEARQERFRLIDNSNQAILVARENS